MKKKENNKINSITRKYISERSVSEIDFDLYSEILGKDWSADYHRLTRIKSEFLFILGKCLMKFLFNP